MVAETSAQKPLPCAKATAVSFGMVPAISASLSSLWSKIINREMKKRSCLKLVFGSASNFRKYIEKAEQGHYDFLAVPAHIASYLITSAAFRPVAFLVWESSYLYIVPADSGINTIQQLSGHTVALPDPLTEASILAHADLSATSEPVVYRHYQGYGQTIQALLSAEVDAAVVLSPFFNRIPRQQHDALRVVHRVPFPFHGLLLAAPRTSEQQRQTMFTALAAFAPGAGFFWQSFQRVSNRQLSALHRSQQDSVAVLKGLINAD